MSDDKPDREHPELAAVLQQFPPVAHAFAYGSGVFRQPGLYTLGSGDKPMLDFIFAVDAPAQWHAQVCDTAFSDRGLTSNITATQAHLLQGQAEFLCACRIWR